jgi:hypothetical protein
MSTSLRSLLGARVDTNIPDIVGRTAPIALNEDVNTLIFGSICTVVFDETALDTYCHYKINSWTVPTNTTEIVFEIWGGGGGGAGACCCQWGVPGGSGAYARKTVTGTLGGCQYEMVIASPTCCSPNAACGFRGCTTYISGFGLSNFCAEGGIPGCTICSIHTVFNSGVYFVPSQENQCACYYGADYGVPGRPGGLHGNFSTPSACEYKNIHTVPPELPGISALGGTTYYQTRILADQDTQISRRCKIGNGFVGSRLTATPGTGGASAVTCAGSCFCGSPGHPGLIRVSYK